MKLKYIFAVIFLFFLMVTPVQAEQAVNIYFFYSNQCPHCHQEQIFLTGYEKEAKNIKVHSYEIAENLENQKLVINLAKQLDIKINSVPITIINGNVIYGYLNEQTTGRQIKNVVEKCRRQGCPDPVGQIIFSGQAAEKNEPLAEKQPPESKEPITSQLPALTDGNLQLPLIGSINVQNFSLPILTFIIAAFDGFNPCAMWVLVFLITLLFGMKNKKRMWILGISFIIASGFVYFLFLSAWLNLFLFIGTIFAVRLIIGLVAIASGSYNLYEYFQDHPLVCKVVGGSQRRQKVFDRIKAVINQKNLFLALSGIILLAFAVNLVELACSAGLPAIYTNVLSLANLPSWQYYGYLGLYVIVFMLDDILVFVVAMTTLQITGVTEKYTRPAKLIGGLVIFVLGILLIFKPEILMLNI